MKTLDKLVLNVAVPFPQKRPRGKYADEPFDTSFKITMHKSQLKQARKAMEAIGVESIGEFIRLSMVNMTTAILREVEDDGKTHA